MREGYLTRCSDVDAEASLGATAIAPSSPLNDHSVPIRVFKGTTQALPVRIECLNRFESGPQHGRAPLLPFAGFRDIEDKKILRRRCRLHRMVAAVRELEVEAHASVAEHDSIEALMISEAVDLFETEPAPVHGDAEAEVANRACYAEMSIHGLDGCRFTFNALASLVIAIVAVVRLAEKFSGATRRNFTENASRTRCTTGCSDAS